jgi:K+-sensing histidine kinase KdpD
VDKRFFRVRYNYREAQRSIGKDLQNAVDARLIASSVVGQLNDLLQPERIALIIKDGDHTKPLASYPAADPVDVPVKLLQDVTIYEQMGLPEVVESGTDIKALESVDSRSSYKLYVSLSADTSNEVGVLALGRKRSDQRYSSQDIDLLRTIAQQAGLAIERIRLTEELIEQRMESQRLKDLSDFKSFIVNSISHDLKTPISSIKLYAQLLHRGILKQGDPKRLEEFIDIIEGESNRLTSLIDNVLDHGRIERGVMQYQKSIVELNGLVNDVMRSFMYLLHLQGFNYTARLSVKPLYIYADPTSVQNILINLITNAVKYSKEIKDITIVTEEAHGQAQVSVSDRGIGIPEEQLQQIFIPFFRVDNHNDGLQARGVGLGLSNVKSMMADHEGSCEVESQLGAGTRFTLSFPIMPELGEELDEHLEAPIHA